MPINLQETKPLDLLSLQKPILAERRKSPENQGARHTSRATNHLTRMPHQSLDQTASQLRLVSLR
jgi:hypothetical protein